MYCQHNTFRPASILRCLSHLGFLPFFAFLRQGCGTVQPQPFLKASGLGREWWVAVPWLATSEDPNIWLRHTWKYVEPKCSGAAARDPTRSSRQPAEITFKKVPAVETSQIRGPSCYAGQHKVCAAARWLTELSSISRQGRSRLL